MTHQEIYNELGNPGTLAFVFIEMAYADEELGTDELAQVAKSMKYFVPEEVDVDKIIANTLDIYLKIEDFDYRWEYILSGLSLFAQEFDVKMKNGILNELVKIAKSDENIHQNENELYKVAHKFLAEG